MHLCIYASMHLCIYASMHLCIYASMHLCIYACSHAWMMDGWMDRGACVRTYVYYTCHVSVLPKPNLPIAAQGSANGATHQCPDQHIHWCCEGTLWYLEVAKLPAKGIQVFFWCGQTCDFSDVFIFEITAVVKTASQDKQSDHTKTWSPYVYGHYIVVVSLP